jgi:hypothetical protein
VQSWRVGQAKQVLTRPRIPEQILISFVSEPSSFSSPSNTYFEAATMWPLKNRPASDQALPPEPLFIELRSSTSFIVATVCIAAFSVSRPSLHRNSGYVMTPRLIGVCTGCFCIWSGSS